jgi:hypothetical protein
MKHLRSLLAGLLVIGGTGCGKSEQVLAAEHFEKAACACKDLGCTKAADKAYGEATCGKGFHGATFFCDEKGKKFRAPSDSDLGRMRGPEERAEACVGRFVPHRQTCGGEPGAKCPEGFHCVMNKDEAGQTDRQGQCYRVGEKP